MVVADTEHRSRSAMPCSISANKAAACSEDASLLPSLAKLIDDAHQEFDRDHRIAKLLLTRAASLLRVEIERQSSDIAHDRKSGGLVAWQIRRLNVFIEAKLHQPILLQELSAVSRLSTAYFCRAFKRTFQETPHSYLVRRRLERAESYMLTSDLPLSDIALRCGFTDQAHLCKLFRRRNSQTPAAWRRERRELNSPKPMFAPRGERSIELH
jgi:AraC family transcriptional regulator